MNITGLTGQSGSGKTTVANLMADLGFYHINCDKIVHEKVYTSKTVLNKISNAFGNEYIENGALNRRKLGNTIFSDRKQYDKLMNLVREDIIAAVEKEIALNSDKPILLDAPTLFEFGMQNKCDRIIGVISDCSIPRICKRDKISVEDAKLRLSNQKKADFFKNNCSIIIENNFENIEELKVKISEIARQILKG